ncbi:MAG: PucR family transcriptional regulator [Chloroflexi bacterium]|nr:MAG: PucR family transcriptional regulator [Chloroflexota bacterium]
MLTVADVLKLEYFARAQVVAGKKGLNREITWVHNAGTPDAADWLNGGELVLTTAINIPTDDEGQRQYIYAMADKAVAALAIAVGRYIDRASDALREAAEARDLPLIEIPYQVRFIDVARTINEQIAQSHLAMVRRALHIHQTLSRLVLEGGDLQQLCHLLVELVGQSISIETERFEAIASENVAEVDEARRYTLAHGRTDPRLIAALEERGVLPELRRTLRPVHIPQMPDVGLEMERILAPVVVHGEIYGYMWIIADNHALSDLDRLAIESGSTVAALIMLHQEAVQSAEASLKGSLLSQLIQGELEREAVLTDQSLRYGLDLRASYRMLVIENLDERAQRVIQLYRRINRLAADSGWRAVVGQFAGQVVILAQAEEDANHIAQKILKRVINGNGTVRIGISAVQRGAANVGRAHKQCREALLIMQRLEHQETVVCFDDLGYLHALYHAGAASLQDNPYVPRLRDLQLEQQADLFRTLEAYLDAGGNGVQTAERLHIHRSTLNYRLARIVEICQVDLGDPTTRMNLQVALKLIRLFDNPEQPET